ncbi:hypothetical protein BH10ACI3_BH10ACI3_11700 [soil metagenome]
MKTAVFILSVFAIVLFVTPSRTLAQRDYLTPEEVELIREAQEIDKRVEILVKAIDRRFDALKIDVGGAKIGKKDIDKWGELPLSSKHELLLDIKRILQKAIDDIDSLAERPDSAYIEPDPKDREKNNYAALFPKAVRGLAKAAERYRPALKGLLDTTLANAEKGAVLDSMESCDEIIAAVGKLPNDSPKKGKVH